MTKRTRGVRSVKSKKSKQLGTARQWGYARALVSRLGKKKGSSAAVHQVVNSLGGVEGIVKRRNPRFKMPKTSQKKYLVTVAAMSPVIADLEKVLGIKRRGGKIVKKGKR